jgi:hypothetical protein
MIWLMLEVGWSYVAQITYKTKIMNAFGYFNIKEGL